MVDSVIFVIMSSSGNNDARTSVALALGMEKPGWARCVAASAFGVLLLNRFVDKDKLPLEFQGSDGISNAVQLASKYAEMERGRTTFNARCKELEDLLCLLSEAFDRFSAERVEQKESLLKTIDAAVSPLSIASIRVCRICRSSCN